jgi:hypothetical protein
VFFENVIPSLSGVHERDAVAWPPLKPQGGEISRKRVRGRISSFVQEKESFCMICSQECFCVAELSLRIKIMKIVTKIMQCMSDFFI